MPVGLLNADLGFVNEVKQKHSQISPPKPSYDEGGGGEPKENYYGK
jgi:hypothetical protein